VGRAGRAPFSANFAELLPVVQNLPDSAVLATDDEALVWLYSAACPSRSISEPSRPRVDQADPPSIVRISSGWA